MLEFGRGEWKQFSHLPLRHPLSGITSTLNWLSCGISLQRGWCGPWFECQNSHFLFFHHVTIYIHNWFTEVLVSSFEHSNTYRDEVDVIRRAFYYRSFNFSFFFTAARFTLLCTLLVYGLTGEVKTLCQNLSGLQPPPPKHFIASILGWGEANIFHLIFWCQIEYWSKIFSRRILPLHVWNIFLMINPS